MSLRTFQRLMRLARISETDPLLVQWVNAGAKIGQAEWYAADPKRLRKLKRWLKQQQGKDDGTENHKVNPPR